MNSNLIDTVRKTYREHFEAEPIIVFSPGRINLIGEHTDYNNGFVFPAAIDKGIYLAIGKSSGLSEIIANDVKESHQFSTHEQLQPIQNGSWRNYVLGVIQQLKVKTAIPGEINIVFGGDIPIGSGLSSSAALENAVGYGLNEIFGLCIKSIGLLKISQKAEHEFVGVKCGIMDQFASMMGEKDRALLLDCKTLHYDSHSVDLEDYTFLLINSNVEHNLVNSEYNVRRSQCEEGVAILKCHYPEIDSLRDVSLSMLGKHKGEFNELIFKRCRYVLEENERVLQLGASLDRNDLRGVGQILYDGHKGMRYQYDITCDQIDFLVDFTNDFSGILGARMMGGGFGGCTINLIHRDCVDQFIEEISTAYRKSWNIEVTPIHVEISSGVYRLD